jgi:hypothetical protein
MAPGELKTASGKPARTYQNPPKPTTRHNPPEPTTHHNPAERTRTYYNTIRINQ